jgi:hypothetical protein
MRATRCVVSLVGAVRPDSRLIFSFMSTAPPWPVSGPMCCAFNARTAERQAQDTGGALGHESDPAATLFPLAEKPAAYPVEIRETSRRVDRMGRALVEPAKAKIAQRTLLTLQRYAHAARGPVGRSVQPAGMGLAIQM